jgi:hypothetical protein
MIEDINDKYKINEIDKLDKLYKLDKLDKNKEEKKRGMIIEKIFYIKKKDAQIIQPTIFFSKL